MIARPAQVLPTDRRYMRRRSNRRVRKVRRVRTLARWAWFVGTRLALLALLALAAQRAVGHFLSSPRFAVREVRVEGVTRASRAALGDRLAGLVGQNLFDLDLAAVAGLPDADPWVRRASVRRLLPGTLQVRIEERRPAALSRIDGELLLVDDEGAVIEPAGPDAPAGLPAIVGLDRMDPARRDAALARGVRALARLRRTSPEWAGRIAELDLARADRVGVRTAGPGPLVLLDPERVARNVDRYVRLRGEIERLAGPAEYVDLRWRNQIAVMPAGDG